MHGALPPVSIRFNHVDTKVDLRRSVILCLNENLQKVCMLVGCAVSAVLPLFVCVYICICVCVCVCV
jgi:hypothetical protein